MGSSRRNPETTESICEKGKQPRSRNIQSTMQGELQGMQESSYNILRLKHSIKGARELFTVGKDYFKKV